MRVLILGGTGFIGPWVVRRLVAAGHEVAVYHRGQTAADLPPSVRHIAGERDELPARRDELTAFAPNLALDMRAMTERDAQPAGEPLAGVARRRVALSSQDVYRAYGRLI